jgi:hypothetical protein
MNLRKGKRLMVIEKQLMEINLELKAISESIEKSLTALHKFENVQSTKRGEFENNRPEKEG